MPDGGKLEFHTGLCHLTDEKIKAIETQMNQHFEAQSGDFIVIDVSDSGEGIPGNVIPHVFEPFFTTKEQDKGTGMGLPAVLGTVLSHNGLITVESEKGQGTTFHIYLPHTPDMAKTATPVSTEISPLGLNIMVIDDEPMVLTIYQKLLEKMGHSVQLFNDGQSASESYKELQDEIDLVIMDMSMPGLNGCQTFQLLQGINPEVRAIIATGNAESPEISNALNTGLKGLIHKPFYL